METDEPVKQHSILTKGISEQEALLICSALEAEGIDCHYKTENMGMQIGGSMAQSVVFVDEAHLSRAQEIQSSLKTERLPLETSTKPNKKESSSSKISQAIVLLITSIFVGAVAFKLGADQTMAKVKETQPKTKRDVSGRWVRTYPSSGTSRIFVSEYLNAKGERTEVAYSFGEGKPPFASSEIGESGKELKQLLDRNYDGKIDTWSWYGENEIPARREIDLDFDGSPDAFEEMDSMGATTKMVVKSNGSVISETTYQKGAQKEARLDLGRKGKFDTLFLFDKMGVPSKISNLDHSEKGRR